MRGVGPLPSSRIASLLSEAECLAVIRWLEGAGFERTGLAYPKDYRDNDRAVIDAPQLARALFDRARSWLPEALVVDGGRWALRGLNSRFRACRYRDGQSFCVHRDGPWARSATERSWMTLQVYLNGPESFAGGETRFYSDRTAATLVHCAVARAGDAIVFDHQAWHDGAPVPEGTKYVFRTDVLFERSTREALDGERRHDGYAWSVIALEDGTLASCGRDGRVKVWSDPVREHDLGDGSVTALVALSDGAIAAGTRAGGLFVLQGDRAERRASFGAAVLALATDGSRVFAGLSDGTVATFDGDRAVCERTASHGASAWVWGVAWSPEGLGSVGSDGRLVVHGRERARWDAGLTALAWVGDRWIVGDARGRVRDGARVFVAHEGAVTSIAALGEGLFATTGEDGALRVHERGAVRLEQRGTDFARSAARTARGVAWCGYDGVVRERSIDRASP